MGVSKRRKLETAMRGRRLVSFFLGKGDDEVEGYIIEVGSEIVLIAPVTDRIHFDGFECFWIEDVSELITHPNADFVEAALAKRGESMPTKPELRLDDVADLITDAAGASPLVTLDTDDIDSDLCWIGKVLGIEKGSVKMLLVDPNAQWNPEPKLLPLESVTRVAFGGDYEEALYLVAGEPPAARPAPSPTTKRRGPSLN